MDDMEYEAEILTLTDEEGNDVEFEILDEIDYEDRTYLVLLPLEVEDADEVLILSVEAEGEEETFLPVEDDDVLEKVFDLFKERNDDIFDFAD